MTVYNVYCDESGHLENDHQRVMVLGAIWCPLERSREIAQAIRRLKQQHGLAHDFEIKWTKVSPAKASFYRAMIDYFFSEDDLHFRTLIVPDKTLLRHEDYGQDHDTWYYKMHFNMLKLILSPDDQYRIYVDVKDTRSTHKVRMLHEVLSNNMYDFSRTVIARLQTVRSHEIEQMQLADLLIGAVAYANRGAADNAGKISVVELLRQRSGYALTKSTLFRESKVNLFCWRAEELKHD